jgi:hypothetical protein
MLAAMKVALTAGRLFEYLQGDERSTSLLGYKGDPQTAFNHSDVYHGADVIDNLFDIYR